jgi:hypothetical protein
VELTTDRNRSNAGRLGWLLAYLYSAWLVTHAFFTFTGLEWYQKASLSAMVTGTADRPFITRALMPATINGLSALIPPSARSWIESAMTSPGFYPEFRLRGYSLATFLFFVLALSCFAGTAYVLRVLVRHYYRVPEWLAGLSGAAGLLLLPLMFRYFNYIYDPATILLASLMALCLARRQARWLFYVFVVACVNKETAILALPLFVAFYWKEWPKWAIAAYGTLLVAVWAGIRGFLKTKYSGSPGTDLEVHWQDHQMRLLSKYPMATLYLVVFAVGFVLLARYRWREKPWEVRTGLLLTLVPLFAMAAAVGYIDEIRALYDAYPFMFLAIVPGLVRLVGGRDVFTPDTPIEELELAAVG